MDFTHHAMPMYTGDHSSYCKQMYEWHTKMHQYQERMKNYHLEQARYYQNQIGEKVQISELKTDNDFAG